MTAEERSELRVVLRALHQSATTIDRPGDDDEAGEWRGNTYGSPRFHEGVELWARVLAIAEADERDPMFETAWRALVNQAHRALAR